MGNNTKAFYNTKIPEGWEVMRLEDACSHFKSGFGITSEQIFDSGIYPVYGGNGLRGFTNSYTHEGDYLLIGRQGALCGNIQRVLGKVYISEHAIAVQTNNINNIDFLAYKLEFKNLNRLSESSAQPGLAVEKLLRLKIEFPPLSEQKVIARVLSTWDQAIHLTEQLIAQKERRKKWLMQKLLTGKIRLKGFGGEWKKEKLEKYLEKHDEKTTTNNQYPVLTSSRKGIFFQSDYYNRDVASEDNTGYNVVPRGYFTYRHMSDDLIFKFNLNDIVDKGIVSTLYPVFKTKGINDYFLLTKLNDGNEFKMHAGEQKQGGSRTYVYFNTLCQLKLNLPSIEEQTAIARVLQAADKEISLLKAKVEKMREQKKGLMQVLLTGKKRLKVNQ